jgi:hypothetical protein
VIGWRGVSLRVPEDWTLTKVSNEGATGYLKADSLEGSFVQIKWSEKKGMVSVPDSFDRYVQDLQKAAKKNRRHIDIRTKPKALAGVHRTVDAPITYSWQEQGQGDTETRRRGDAGVAPSPRRPVASSQKALGLMYHCGECRRLVIAEVVASADADLGLAAPILASIREHGEAGWNTWGVHGLTAEVPNSFQLERHTLVTGHVMLRFRSRSRLLVLQQWGLANIALKGTDIAEWYEYQERNRLSRYTYRRDRSPFRGHEALRMSGRDKFVPAIAKAFHHVSGLSRPALGFSACVWHCDETNRIYAVSAEHSRGDDTFHEVLRRMLCHPGAP